MKVTSASSTEARGEYGVQREIRAEGVFGAWLMCLEWSLQDTRRPELSSFIQAFRALDGWTIYFFSTHEWIFKNHT